MNRTTRLRSICVTHYMEHGTPEEIRQLRHEMNHSKMVQQRHYNRSSPRRRSAPAAQTHQTMIENALAKHAPAEEELTADRTKKQRKNQPNQTDQGNEPTEEEQCDNPSPKRRCVKWQPHESQFLLDCIHVAEHEGKKISVERILAEGERRWPGWDKTAGNVRNKIACLRRHDRSSRIVYILHPDSKPK